MYDNLFIGTPTHACKQYCAGDFIKASIENAPKAWHATVCNSRRDISHMYHLPEFGRMGRKMELGDDFYGQKDSIHRRLVVSMNYLRAAFLSTGKPWFLSLEADVLLRKDTLPLLFDIAGHATDDNIQVLHANCYPGFNTSEVICKTERITLGCTLIHREVMERLEFRYEPAILAAFHDAFFGHDAVAAGFAVYYTPFAICDHAHDEGGHRGWQDLNPSEK